MCVQGHICISSKLLLTKQYTECRKGLSTSGIKLKISCIQSLFIYFLRGKKDFSHSYFMSDVNINLCVKISRLFCSFISTVYILVNVSFIHVSYMFFTVKVISVLFYSVLLSLTGYHLYLYLIFQCPVNIIC